MRHTAKITLLTGFSFSSLVTVILSRYGTDFTTLTSVLYLYGFVCLIGGVIGYRKAFLKHGKERKEVSFKDLLGLETLLEKFRTRKWRVELENTDIRAESIKVHGKLVSAERVDGTKISFPRKSVEKIEKLSPGG